MDSSRPPIDSRQAATEPRRRLEPWPVALALALLAMIGASVAFYAVARANPDPVLVDDAYAAGLRYNAEKRALERGDALGVALELRTRPAPGGVRVEVALREPDGSPAPASAVRVRRERPAEGGLDAGFELLRDPSPGATVFAATVPLPRPGRWHLIATADVRGERLRRTFALEAP